MTDEIYRLLVAASYAIPSFALSARFYHVWRAPLEVEEGRWINLGVGVLTMEFILLHAGTFLGAQAIAAGNDGNRLLGIAGILAFYCLFVGAIALAFRSPSLAYSFLWLIGGRFVATALGVGRQDGELLLAHSIVGSVIYFALVIGSVVVPIPRLGITAELAARHRLPGSSGTWVDEPHRAIAAGALYFLLFGIAEVALLTMRAGW